jgi:hypothetical protein
MKKIALCHSFGDAAFSRQSNEATQNSAASRRMYEFEPAVKR